MGLSLSGVGCSISKCEDKAISHQLPIATHVCFAIYNAEH